MRHLRWGTLLLLVLACLSLLSPAATVQGDVIMPLGVLEISPGTPDTGELVSVFVNAEEDAVTSLYLNDMIVDRRIGSGELLFMAELPGLRGVRLVRKTGSLVEEAVGVVPVGLAEYADHSGERVLLVPTAKLDTSLKEQFLTEPVFTSTQVRVIARGLEQQDSERKVSALTTMGAPLGKARVLSGMGAVAGTANGDSLRTLLSNPYLTRLEADEPVRMMLADSVPLVNADEVWGLQGPLGNITGKNVTIAIIDTGIDYTHPDLGGCLGATCKVWPGYDYVNNDADPMDDNGHGTHVAGIAAANGSAKGVAPDATLVAYKVLDLTGEGKASDVIAAIENASAAGYDIISLSLGGQGNADDAMSTAVDNAVAAGSVVVVAAGNSGPSASTIGSPGTARLAITVGNTDKSDVMRDSSSRGPNPSTLELKPELTAPGVEISSTALGGGNTSYNGTSQSAPHVSGAAALLLQLQPTLTPGQVKAALVGTAADLGFNVTDQGAGRLDAFKAVNVSFVSEQPTLSLGTRSSRLSNVTAKFNLTNLANVSTSVSLRAFLRTGDGNVSLNASVVTLPALGSASVELFINLTTTPNGVYSGLITANSSATNISIPFWVQISGWRTKLIEDVSGASQGIYKVAIGDADNDGDNEIVIAVDSQTSGWVRIGDYNSNGTWNFTNSPVINSVFGLDIGDADNDGLNEIITGEKGGQIRKISWNGSSWGVVLINDTIDDSIDDVTIGDADNDGLNDIIAAGFVNGGNGSIYLAKWANQSWVTETLHLCDCQRPWRVVVGDINNDSENEIVSRRIKGGIVYVRMFKWDNVSYAWNWTNIDSFDGGTAGEAMNFLIADTDEDGDEEVLVVGYITGPDSWIRGYAFLGNATWDLLFTINSTDIGWDSVVWGDADNDGDFEYVIGGGSLSTSIVVLYHTAAPSGREIIDTSVPNGPRRIDVGNALNRGLNEITYGEASGDGVYISYAIAPPILAQFLLNMSFPTTTDSPGVSAAVQDSDVLTSVTLYYSTDGFTWNSTAMSRAYNYTYQAQIPTYPANTTVQYYIKAIDEYGETNQTPLFNYTVLNLLGNASDVQSNISNLTVTIAGSGNLTQVFTGVQAVEFSANGTKYVGFDFNFSSSTLNFNTLGLFTQSDNSSGWILVQNVTQHTGTNKTLYLDNLNLSADAVCVKDAEVESILNVSADCTGSNEMLVPCVNVSVSGYRCENISGRWKLSGAQHSAAKEMENPAPTLSGLGPSGTLTSSSTTLTVTSSEAATCKYSTTSQGYDAMPSSFSTTGGTSHSQSLSGLANGAYTYYVRCRDNGDKDSSEGTISFTVSVSSGSSGGGGGGAPATNPNVKETTYASLSAGKENTLIVDRTAIPATKVGFVNTVRATNVKLSVSVVNTTSLENPLDAAYGYFNVTLSGLDADKLGGSWIEFKVNTSWIAEQGAPKGDVRLKRQGTAWEELPTAWTRDSGAYSYFNASTPGFSVFAIALATREPVVTEPVLEPLANVTEPQPEPIVNATVAPPANETREPPVQPPADETKPLWPYALVALVLLAAAGAGYRSLRTKRPKKPALSATPEQLAHYVRKCRGLGFSDDSIRKKMLAEGVDEALIDAALKEK